MPPVPDLHLAVRQVQVQQHEHEWEGVRQYQTQLPDGPHSWQELSGAECPKHEDNDELPGDGDLLHLAGSLPPAVG